MTDFFSQVVLFVNASGVKEARLEELKTNGITIEYRRKKVLNKQLA